MANLIAQVAETLDMKRKQVRVVYDAIVEQVKGDLKENRKSRLPGFGIVSVKSKPARPKRRGMNPFTKKEQWFKAKPASNKVKFRPAKDLKVFADKLKVRLTKKKKKR